MRRILHYKPSKYGCKNGSFGTVKKTRPNTKPISIAAFQEKDCNYFVPSSYFAVS